MKTLKEAIEGNNLIQFIKERKGDPNGNANTFNATLNSMTKKSKPTPKTSSRAAHDD